MVGECWPKVGMVGSEGEVDSGAQWLAELRRKSLCFVEGRQVLGEAGHDGPKGRRKQWRSVFGGATRG